MTIAAADFAKRLDKTAEETERLEMSLDIIEAVAAQAQDVLAVMVPPAPARLSMTIC